MYRIIVTDTDVKFIRSIFQTIIEESQAKAWELPDRNTSHYRFIEKEYLEVVITSNYVEHIIKFDVRFQLLNELEAEMGFKKLSLFFYPQFKSIVIYNLDGKDRGVSEEGYKHFYTLLQLLNDMFDRRRLLLG